MFLLFLIFHPQVSVAIPLKRRMTHNLHPSIILSLCFNGRVLSVMNDCLLSLQYRILQSAGPHYLQSSSINVPSSNIFHPVTLSSRAPAWLTRTNCYYRELWPRQDAPDARQHLCTAILFTLVIKDGLVLLRGRLDTAEQHYVRNNDRLKEGKVAMSWFLVKGRPCATPPFPASCVWVPPPRWSRCTLHEHLPTEMYCPTAILPCLTFRPPSSFIPCTRVLWRRK